MATIAVFLALGGGAYAAIELVGKNDIRSKHIKNGQVKDRDLAGPTYWAVVDSDGGLARSGQGNTSSSRTAEGKYVVDFARGVRSCAYIATTGRSDSQSAAAGAINVRSGETTDTVLVDAQDLAANDEDRGFHLAVHC